MVGFSVLMTGFGASCMWSISKHHSLILCHVIYCNQSDIVIGSAVNCITCIFLSDGGWQMKFVHDVVNFMEIL
jgi:hypothetical protein